MFVRSVEEMVRLAPTIILLTLSKSRRGEEFASFEIEATAHFAGLDGIEVMYREGGEERLGYDELYPDYYEPPEEEFPHVVKLAEASPAKAEREIAKAVEAWATWTWEDGKITSWSTGDEVYHRTVEKGTVKWRLSEERVLEIERLRREAHEAEEAWEAAAKEVREQKEKDFDHAAEERVTAILAEINGLGCTKVARVMRKEQL